MQISVDGSDFVEIGLEHLVGKDGTNQLSGQEIADELTNVIQERFGDGKKFDVSAYYASGAAITSATLDITRDYGESNESYLSVPVGNIIAAAIQQGDIVLTGASTTPMVMPEEFGHGDEQVFCWGLCCGDSCPGGSYGHEQFGVVLMTWRLNTTSLGRRCVLRSLATTRCIFTTDAPLSGELSALWTLALLRG